VSLESIEAREQALEDPVGFSARDSRGAIVDEAQRAPDLDLSRERLNAPFTAPQCEPSVPGSVRYPQLAAGDRRSALPSCHANLRLAGPSAPHSAFALGESRNSRAWRILAYGGHPALREGPLSLTTYRALAVFSLVPLAHAQTPTTYCTAGTTVQGCVPAISGVGAPSALVTSGFDIVVDNVPTQRMGLIFYGLNSIPTPQPWSLGSSSYLCIYYPVNRTGAQSSGGSLGPCDGELRVDFNAWRAANPTALGAPFSGGQVLHAQGWFRDPGAAKQTNLSDALRFTLFPPNLLPCVSAIPGLVVIPAGTFTQGSNAPDGPPYYGQWDDPVVRQVTISYCFWMGATEVTQAQYSSLMGTDPSAFPGPNSPVEQVSWVNAQAYCAALTAQQAALGNVPPGYQYRLPTEAEWEYACRAGTTTEYNVGSVLFCNQAKFSYSSHSNSSCNSGSTVQVASYAMNAWGLYDMHGNVSEWCIDSHAGYSAGAFTDPFITGGTYRVRRGGGFASSFNCRSAYRDADFPSYTSGHVGFRVVLAPILVP